MIKEKTNIRLKDHSRCYLLTHIARTKTCEIRGMTYQRISKDLQATKAGESAKRLNIPGGGGGVGGKWKKCLSTNK